MDLATSLAIVVILTAVPGASFSGLYAWRNRGALDVGLLAILVTGCLLCMWSGGGYAVVIATTPNPPPPITTNIIILRPLQIFWNLLWAAVPLHLSARSQAIGQGAELHAVRQKNRECISELATLKMKNINLEQALEMRETTVRRFSELLDIKTQELLELKEHHGNQRPPSN